MIILFLQIGIALVHAVMYRRTSPLIVFSITLRFRALLS
jgi:hypothetical protein